MRDTMPEYSTEHPTRQTLPTPSATRAHHPPTTHASATSCSRPQRACVMLSLAKATKAYYLQKLGEISPREDYYLQGGLATGVWRGSGAAELGLEGTVSAERLVRLFDGEHSGTGAQLGRRLRKDGVAAWDVTDIPPVSRTVLVG